MPYKDPEKARQNGLERQMRYYEKNREKVILNKRAHRQTDAGKKARIINKWKHYGLICDNYEALYEHYINTFECDNCGIELVSGNCANKRCMDHCHITGKFRNILCNTCNIQRGYDDRSNN